MLPLVLTSYLFVQGPRLGAWPIFFLYVSVTNTKAYATLVTELNFSGYVLFNFFILYFL